MLGGGTVFRIFSSLWIIGSYRREIIGIVCSIQSQPLNNSRTTGTDISRRLSWFYTLPSFVVALFTFGISPLQHNCIVFHRFAAFLFVGSQELSDMVCKKFHPHHDSSGSWWYSSRYSSILYSRRTPLPAHLCQLIYSKISNRGAWARSMSNVPFGGTPS